MEAYRFDQNKFQLVCVDRTKKTPDNLQEGLNIIRVPTFIFYRNEVEIGRYDGTIYEDRLCKRCVLQNLSLVECEYHVLMKCVAYSEIRNLYFCDRIEFL